MTFNSQISPPFWHDCQRAWKAKSHDKDKHKTDIEGTRRARNHRPTRKRKTGCYGHKGKKMQNKEKWNACKGISIDREMLRHLSRKVSRKTMSTDEAVEEQSKDTRREARSIHQVSRSYRGGRRFLDRSTRYRGAVEEVSSKLFKIVFRKEKNTDINAIQLTT